MPKPIIEISHLYKKYSLGHRQPYLTLQEVLMQNIRSPLRLLRSIGGNDKNHLKNGFWALRDINLKVMPGEIVGIIGKNGAGKSTLLKLISRITYPTKGEIVIRGKVSSLLEVGTGFHPELTGRENIYLNGAILGMKRREIKSKFDAIVNFAQIPKFIDTPVKYYSSGMYVRLAFAVAAHLETEILVVDEVLAVGDIAFQKKCLGKIDEITHKQGRTVIFVSHNMASIRQLCSRCLLLENGKTVVSGSVSRVIDKYLNRVLSHKNEVPQKVFREDKKKEFQLLSACIVDREGKLTNIFACDKPFYIRLNCISRKPIPGLYGYLSFTNQEGIIVWVSDTLDTGLNRLDALSLGRYQITIAIPPRTLGHGTYNINLGFTSTQSTKGFFVDVHKYICRFELGDFSSDRGNKRDGYLSTILNWEVEKS